MDVLLEQRLCNGDIHNDTLFLNGNIKFSLVDKINDNSYVISDSNNSLKYMRIFDKLIKVYNIVEKVTEENNYKNMDDSEIIDMIKKYSYVLTIDDKKFNIFKDTCNSYLGFCPNRFDGVLKSNAVLSCGTGHQNMITMAKENNFPFIIVFEDDAVGRENALDKLVECIKNIPVDCDVLALGGIGYCPRRQVHLKLKDDDLYYIMYRGINWGSQAYICFRRGYDKIIKNLRVNKIADHSIFHSYRNNIYRLNECLFLQASCKDCFYMHGRITKNTTYYYHDEKLNKQTIYHDNPPQNFVKIVY